MEFALKIAVLSLIVAAGLAAPALADFTVEEASFAGAQSFDWSSGTWSNGGASSNFEGVAYDSTTLPIGNATSSTDLAAIYGDQTNMVGTGIVDAFKFTVFCSSSSAANLTSATQNISFFRGSDSSYIGGFTVSLGALAKGFYTTITVTSLASLGINLDVSTVVVTQQLTNVVGATRMGTILSFANSPMTGSSNNGFFASSAATTAGYYVLSGQTFSNMWYQTTLVPTPGAFALLGLAGLASRRRR